MIYSELPWKQLTQRLYEERFVTKTRTEADELDAAHLWTEAARRVKLIARKGFRRTIPAYDLEDIEQRVLIKLLAENALRTAAGSNAPGIYIAHMIRNEVLDHVRKRARESFMGAPLEDNLARPTQNFEFENAAVRELFTRLESELATLPAAARDVLKRKFWEGADIREIAHDLGLPYSTVAKRLFRAMARLRERFDANAVEN
jgi:RNA polymerase sigma factor (sigma-70 family)